MLENSNSSDAGSQAVAHMLSQPESFLPVFAEAIQEGMFIFTQDTQGVVRYVSPSIEQILQLNAADLTGKHFDTFLADDPQNEKLRKGCWRQIPVGKVACCRCVLRTAHGVAVPVRMWNLMQGGDAGSAGVIGVAIVDRSGPAGADVDNAEVQRILELEKSLTDSERAVVELVVDGQMNKAMARILGVAVRTIEARRARAMSKLQVRSLPELVKTWMVVRSAKH